MREGDFLSTFSKIFSIILHEVIEILKITWPTIKSLLLATSALLALIGLVAWAVLEDRKALSYS
ncbi:MAG: hypothetical protein QXR35_02455, partial [Candidatus Korarchaeum sp.]